MAIHALSLSASSGAQLEAEGQGQMLASQPPQVGVANPGAIPGTPNTPPKSSGTITPSVTPNTITQATGGRTYYSSFMEAYNAALAYNAGKTEGLMGVYLDPDTGQYYTSLEEPTNNPPTPPVGGGGGTQPIGSGGSGVSGATYYNSYDDIPLELRQYALYDSERGQYYTLGSAGGGTTPPSLGGIQPVTTNPTQQVGTTISGTLGASNFVPDFSKPNPYAGAPLSYFQLEMQNYIPTAENPLPPSLAWLQAHPDSVLIPSLGKDFQPITPKKLTESEYKEYQSASPERQFQILKDKGYIPPNSEFAGVDENGQVLFFSPENILRQKLVTIWNQRVEQLQTIAARENIEIQRQIKDFENKLKDQPKDLQDAYAKGGMKGYNDAIQAQISKFEFGLRTQPQELQDAYKSGGIDAYNQAVTTYNQKIENAQKQLEPYKEIGFGVGGGYHIQDFLKNNPNQDSIQTLKYAGYSQETIDNAQKYIDSLTKEIDGINTGLAKMTVSSADIIALDNAIIDSGISKIDVGGSIAGRLTRNVEATWNSLTDAQKAQVAEKYALDKYKSNFFAELWHTKELADATLPKEIKIAKQVGEIGGAILYPPLGLIIATETVAPLVARASTAQPVSVQEWAIGGATIVLTGLGMGGAKVIEGFIARGLTTAPKALDIGSSIGSASSEVVGVALGRATITGLELGSGAIFTKQTFDTVKNPDIGIPEKAFSIGMDALLFAGIGLGIKGGQSANARAESAKLLISKSVEPQGTQVNIPVKIGETISSVKTFISDVPNRAMTAPEAIKYYTVELGLKAEQVVEIIKRGLLETTPEMAQKIAVNIKFAGEDLAKRIMSTPEAIRYYTEDLGIKTERLFDLAKQNLLEVSRARANQIADQVLAGIQNIEKRIMTAPSAIEYYTNVLGLKVEQVAELARKGLLEVTPELAYRIAQNIKSAGGNIAKRIMTMPEAIEYYSVSLGLKAEHIAELAKRGLLEVTPQAADRIAWKIKDTLNNITNRVLTTPDAISYYAEGLQLKAKDVIALAEKRLGEITTKDADAIIAKIQKTRTKIENIPDAIEYYTQELEIQSGKVKTRISDAINNDLSEIYTAMRNKDKATVIKHAQNLERLSAQLDDGKLAEQLKLRAKDLQEHIDDYLKMSDEIPKSDSEKIVQGMKQTDETIKRTYNDLLNETRPVTEKDVTLVSEGQVAKEVVEVGSKEYDYRAESQRQDNLSKLLNQDRTTTINDIQTYLDAQRARSESLPKLEKTSNLWTIDDIQTYLNSVKAKMDDLKGLDKQIAQETIDDLQTFLDSRAKVAKYSEVIPEEGTIPIRPVDAEQIKLLDSINKDNALLTDLQNKGGDIGDIMQVVNRIQENMAKLAKLRDEPNSGVSYNDAINARLKELGYSEDDIAQMTNTEKLQRVIDETPPSKAGEREPLPEKQSGGDGGGTKVAVKEKTETKTLTQEEIDKLLKEKEVKPEEKPKVETEKKPETKTTTKVEAKPEVEMPLRAPIPEGGVPYYGLVWEDGRIFVKLVTPEILAKGYVKIATETNEAIVPQEEYNRMTPEQRQKLYADVETYKAPSEKYALAPFPQPQPTPKPSPQPSPQPQPTPEPQPLPTPYPEPQPQPSPQPQPFPQPQPLPQPQHEPQPEPDKFKPQPIPPPVETTKPPFVPPVLPELPAEWRKSGVPKGTIEWRQGKKWVALPPPYRDEDKLYLDHPLPGTYKFSVGKGSAYRTLQVINGTGAEDATIDMGWATVNIKSKGKDLEMTFGGGEEAANDRWTMEQQYMDELERQAYANRPQQPIEERIPRMRQPMSLNKQEIPEYSTDNLKVYSVNGAYIRNKYANQMIGDRKGVDFLGGGHEYVYWNIIPSGEIWVENTLQGDDLKGFIAHELEEREQMSKGMEYSEAHNDYANVVEIEGRENPQELDNMIERVIEKYQKTKQPVKQKARVQQDDGALPRRTYLGMPLRPTSLGGRL